MPVRAVSFTCLRMSAVPKLILLVLFPCAPAEVTRVIVRVIPIQVPDLQALRPRTAKSQGHQGRYFEMFGMPVFRKNYLRVSFPINGGFQHALLSASISDKALYLSQ